MPQADLTQSITVPLDAATRDALRPLMHDEADRWSAEVGFCEGQGEPASWIDGFRMDLATIDSVLAALDTDTLTLEAARPVHYMVGALHNRVLGILGEGGTVDFDHADDYRKAARLLDLHAGICTALEARPGWWERHRQGEDERYEADGVAEFPLSPVSPEELAAFAAERRERWRAAYEGTRLTVLDDPAFRAALIAALEADAELAEWEVGQPLNAGEEWCAVWAQGVRAILAELAAGATSISVPWEAGGDVHGLIANQARDAIGDGRVQEALGWVQMLAEFRVTYEV